MIFNNIPYIHTECTHIDCLNLIIHKLTHHLLAYYKALRYQTQVGLATNTPLLSEWIHSAFSFRLFQNPSGF